MFSPQSGRKGWAGWGLSLRSGPERGSGKVEAFRKGKAVAEAPSPPPPQVLLGEPGVGGGGGGLAGEEDVWRSFREAGFLDEAVLERKEKEEMARKIAGLENELHDYQHYMGLLLIEKKDWSLKFAEIRCALEESEKILKQERSAHWIAISELEKREENMQKALEVEKQCVIHLERALHDMQADVAEAKSFKKLAQAHNLEVDLEEKYLEIHSNLHSSGANLAEANRKSSEVDGKLHAAEDNERKLERECLSLNTLQKAFEKDLSEQREHLRDWEKTLQEGQKKLVEGLSALNEREQKAIALERDREKKDREIEEARKNIEITSDFLKEKEDAISTRLRALSSKEKEVDTMQMDLEKKGRELLNLEEKLSAKEKMEIQKLIDDHNMILNFKKEDFERELVEKRSSFDEEVKSRFDVVIKNEHGIKLKEEQILRREKALSDKMEEFKEKEKGIETKEKVLKDRENSLKDEEKKLDEERKQMAKEYQKLIDFKAEIESLRTAQEAKEQQISAKEISLKVIEEERGEYILIQSQLKGEMEDYRVMKESAAKQIDELREEREIFEAQRGELDEKMKGLELELKQINEKREKFEMSRQVEEKKLKIERQTTSANIERELESLRLKKEDFENLMAHGRLQAHESVEREHGDMIRAFDDLRKHFLAMAEQCKTCRNCRVAIGELEPLALEQIIGTEDARNVLLPTVADGFLKEHKKDETTGRSYQGMGLQSVASGGHLSWVRKCLFNSSPGKRAEHSPPRHDRKASPGGEADCELKQLCGIVNDFKQAHSGRDIMANEELERFNKAGDYSEPCFSVADNCIDIPGSQLDNDDKETERVHIILSITEQKEQEASSLPLKCVSQPQSSNQRRHQPSRRGRSEVVKRTRSMKAVVEDAKEILGPNFEDNKDEQPNGDTSEISIREESLGDLVHADQVVMSSRQWKSPTHASVTEASEMDAEDNEKHTDSISHGGHRKRRQTASPVTQTPGSKRYNFRRSTIHSSNSPRKA